MPELRHRNMNLIVDGCEKNDGSNESCFPFKWLDCAILMIWSLNVTCALCTLDNRQVYRFCKRWSHLLTQNHCYFPNGMQNNLTTNATLSLSPSVYFACIQCDHRSIWVRDGIHRFAIRFGLHGKWVQRIWCGQDQEIHSSRCHI